MVAIIAGAGLGLERSSAWVLGSRGQLGQAQLGRGGESVFVNAATGNLILSNTDEMLFGLGEDAAIGRTHNSLGASTDDNGDNWRLGVSRKLTDLPGTPGQAGSTVTRVDWDGSEVVFTWDASRSAYVSKDGGGAYDTLTYSGATWTWKDGATQSTETYDASNNGRLVTRTDRDGNTLSFAYNASGLISRVTTQNGEYTDLSYSGSNLTQIATYRHQSAAGSDALTLLTRVKYGYDGSNRLTSVTVDLSPADSAVTDGNIYTTTFTYDGASKRVASITQSDGSSLQITYDASNRVSTLVQAAASGVSLSTTFGYDVANRTTTITDPLGLVTKLTYDVSGQLTRLASPPPVAGGATLNTDFAYNSSGDLISVQASDGTSVTYTYDANGNRTSEQDTSGNRLERTFGADNQPLTETRYAGAGATNPLTTRYAYDAEGHLRFVVSPEGRVTEYVYSAPGLQISEIHHGVTYDVSSLAATASIAEATLVSWAASLSDRSSSSRTDTAYDFRGSVSSVTRFGRVLANGAGDTSGEVSQTTYVYDQFGKLLSRLTPTASQAETFIYDGLGRLIGSTDLANTTTTVVFNDAARTTQTTITNGGRTGVTKTSTFDQAGRLISYA
jgi:YD repeat-containing protein